MGRICNQAMSKAKLIWSRSDMGILRTGKHRSPIASWPASRMQSSPSPNKSAVLHRRRSNRSDAVQTIYNGLDLADGTHLPAQQKSTDETLVTTVGNIRQMKGHDVLIRAAASIAQQFPYVSFSIAGDVLEPDYYAELQTLVQNLGSLCRFHFVGSVTRLHDHLSAVDLFVLPSRSEGFCNAIIEAMAASLPVVATNVGGNAEAVNEGISGSIVPPEDPEALSTAITVCSLTHSRKNNGRSRQSS